MPYGRVLIRRAANEDVSLIADIGARLFKDTFGQDNPPEDMACYLASSFSKTKIKAELEDLATTFLLAYEAENPIGYAKLRESQNPDCVTGPKPIQLVRLYLDHGVIGKGYGSRLIRACFEEAASAGFQTIWLGVWEKNNRALKFYQKWGFVAVGRHDFILGNRIQNDLIMERSAILTTKFLDCT
ncbi:MAG: GNAT family N-acetyltransferase [Leptolyngbyaceae cyanobacterium MO_188.B28]|nr:GNAT family N-acetyltransferase [Leptolyngbyaceae cyanobacterium MO_188.B28]